MSFEATPHCACSDPLKSLPSSLAFCIKVCAVRTLS
eukprot:COSAG06_NODE_34455_length_474_cov_0.840000_2_plen_35_part_01